MSEALIAESRTFFIDERARPAGRLTLAGSIKNGGGVEGKAMRVLGQFALVLVVRGHGYYADARGTKYDVTRGDALLVLPELPHVYGPRPHKLRGGIWDEMYMCFDGPLFELWRQQGLLDDSRLVRSVLEWPKVFARLRGLCEMPRPANKREHGAQLRELLAILDEVFSPPETMSNEPAWLGRGRGVLESNLDQPLGGHEAAKSAGLSYESFRRAWKAQTGTTPQKYRDQKRIEAAQILLRSGTMTQAQIARSLGWRDEAHLSRRFRELVGTSVREWKARSRAKEGVEVANRENFLDRFGE